MKISLIILRDEWVIKSCSFILYIYDEKELIRWYNNYVILNFMRCKMEKYFLIRNRRIVKAIFNDLRIMLADLAYEYIKENGKK